MTQFGGLKNDYKTVTIILFIYKVLIKDFSGILALFIWLKALMKLITMLETMDTWIDETPPIDQPQRFGNKAFRTWCSRLEEVRVNQLLHISVQEPSKDQFWGSQGKSRLSKLYLCFLHTWMVVKVYKQCLIKAKIAKWHMNFAEKQARCVNLWASVKCEIIPDLSMFPFFF